MLDSIVVAAKHRYIRNRYRMVIGLRYRVFLSGSIFCTFSFVWLRTFLICVFLLCISFSSLSSIFDIHFKSINLSLLCSLYCSDTVLTLCYVIFRPNNKKIKSIFCGVCDGAHGLSKYSILITNFLTFFHLLRAHTDTQHCRSCELINIFFFASNLRRLEYHRRFGIKTLTHTHSQPHSLTHTQTLEND